MDAEERKTAMSHDEMQDYWKTLCSFTGEDIPNEVNQLMAKIRYPRFLYKYRAVNNNNLILYSYNEPEACHNLFSE